MANLTQDQLTALLLLSFITGLAGLFLLWLVINFIRTHIRYRKFWKKHYRGQK
jgi:hypothetical protein